MEKHLQLRIRALELERDLCLQQIEIERSKTKRCKSFFEADIESLKELIRSYESAMLESGLEPLQLDEELEQLVHAQSEGSSVPIKRRTLSVSSQEDVEILENLNNDITSDFSEEFTSFYTQLGALTEENKSLLYSISQLETQLEQQKDFMEKEKQAISKKILSLENSLNSKDEVNKALRKERDEAVAKIHQLEAKVEALEQGCFEGNEEVLLNQLSSVLSLLTVEDSDDESVIVGVEE
ncbi:hypothetical protein RCL1_009142 [Eukaryota sp. TZLM3-RCL]